MTINVHELGSVTYDCKKTAQFLLRKITIQIIVALFVL